MIGPTYFTEVGGGGVGHDVITDEEDEEGDFQIFERM
jgi:hypothetical protein